MGKLSDFFGAQKIPLPEARREQLMALDTEFEQMETTLATLSAENVELRAELAQLQKEVERVKQQLQYLETDSNPYRYFCDHCGSPRLKRVENRSDPSLENATIRPAAFQCLRCGKESLFEPRIPRGGDA